MLLSEFQIVSKTIEQSSFPISREYNNDDPNVFGNDEDMDEQEATDDGENFNNSIDFDMRNENAKEMKQRNKTKCKCIKPHRPTKFNDLSKTKFI